MSEKEIKKLKQWIDDLQRDKFINCVYCGFRYGPDKTTPASMADVLKQHVESCPAHPMSKLKLELKTIAGIGPGLEQDIAALERWWPKAKRGSNAERAFQSLVSRSRNAVKWAKEALQ